MKFREWQQFSPAEAAREIHSRVQGRLSPAQRRAVLAILGTEEELVARFSAAPRDRPLGGVPYFTKDLFDVAGLPSYAGSTFLPEIRPTPTIDGVFTRAL